METRRLVHPEHYAGLSGEELRKHFLVEDLFTPGEVKLVHWEGERTIIGSAVPRSTPLPLVSPEGIKAGHFSDRREIGVANLGAAGGTVTVGGQTHALGPRDFLYIAKGSDNVVFASDRADAPAHFYLVSHPAHAAHPTSLIPQADAETVTIGTAAGASVRTLRRYIHPRGARSCQLVMGYTDLQTGSVWNTMPPHTHTRRTEIYLYFDMDPGAVAFHFMGPPEDTKHIVVRNFQAVLSPAWSMHFGAATSRYAFVWSMGGENQEFEDMHGVALDRLR
ncbi:MAG: 5-dehydro-4-deoxy-D-glucuronate isomerase [Vicinamibacteria bacterium]|nr:5-dehydro-4-deoxy-D-glucuronate isomerase [Vicinamibacteria bacterium]